VRTEAILCRERGSRAELTRRESSAARCEVPGTSHAADVACGDGHSSNLPLVEPRGEKGEGGREKVEDPKEEEVAVYSLGEVAAAAKRIAAAARGASFLNQLFASLWPSPGNCIPVDSWSPSLRSAFSRPILLVSTSGSGDDSRPVTRAAKTRFKIAVTRSASNFALKDPGTLCMRTRGEREVPVGAGECCASATIRIGEQHGAPVPSTCIAPSAPMPDP
jgi:hypothetical protein